MTGWGGDRRSDTFKSSRGLDPGSRVPRQRLAEFRRMAEFGDEPEVVEAIEAGQSRAAVLRACNRAEYRIIFDAYRRGLLDGTEVNR